MLADFGTVNVRSNPAMAPRRGFAASVCSIAAIAAARSGSASVPGKRPTSSATRSATVRNTG